MLKITNPGTELTLADDTKVVVKQMPFLKALEFLKQIGKIADQLFEKNGKFKLYNTEKTAAGATVHLNLDPLQDILQQSSELMAFVILNSTKKDAAWLEERSLAEGLALLKAALEQNLSPEVLELGNGLAGALSNMMPKKLATKTQK